MGVFERAIGYSMVIGRPGLRKKVSTAFAAQQGVVNTDVSGEASADQGEPPKLEYDTTVPDFATLTLDQIKAVVGEDPKGKILKQILAANTNEERAEILLDLRKKQAEKELEKQGKKKRGGKVDTELLRVSKILFQSKEYDDIVKEDSRIRSVLRTIALPSALRHGVYLVPLELIPKVDERVEDYRRNRLALIEKLRPKYAEIIEEARKGLGPLFEETDYLTLEEFIGAFYVNTGYINFGVPELLKKVSGSLFDREKERLAKTVQDAELEIRQVLRAGLKELLDHMVDRLQPGADGKVKVFRNSLVGNLSEFLQTFELRNITDDGDLKKLVDNIRKVMDGVDPEKLRADDGLRQTVTSQIGDIKKALDTMVAEAPGRRFDWE